MAANVGRFMDAQQTGGADSFKCGVRSAECGTKKTNMTEKIFVLRVRLPDWAHVGESDAFLMGEINQFTGALFDYYTPGARAEVSCSIEPEPAKTIAAEVLDSHQEKHR